MDELVSLVQDQQIDIVLMAGDAYDSVNPPAAAETLFYDGLARLADGGRRQVIAIAGNHDNPERLAASAPLALRQGITLVGLPTSQLQRVDVPRTGERALLAALPYPSESRLRELLAEEADESVLRIAYSQRIAQLVARQTASFTPHTVNLIMSHLYVLGGAESESERPIQVGGAYTVDTAAFSAVNAQYTALGHLHRPQQLKANSLIRYSGSPLAYSFSEAGQAKSVTLLDVRPGEAPELTELFLNSGKPLVKWKAVEGIAQVYRWLEEGKDARAWIDLELHLGDSMSMEQIQRLRKQHSGIINIRPVYPQIAKDLDRDEAGKREQLPIDELFRRFYTRQTGGAEAEPALVSLFLELLEQTAESAAAASGSDGGISQ